MITINTYIIYLYLILMFLSFSISILYLLFSSDILNKLLSMEVISSLLISIISLWALFNKEYLYIDICLALSLIIFLSIVAYSQIIFSRLK